MAKSGGQAANEIGFVDNIKAIECGDARKVGRELAGDRGFSIPGRRGQSHEAKLLCSETMQQLSTFDER